MSIQAQTTMPAKAPAFKPKKGGRNRPRLASLSPERQGRVIGLYLAHHGDSERVAEDIGTRRGDIQDAVLRYIWRAVFVLEREVIAIKRRVTA
ncbi:MAG: hypothetical protein U0Q18_25465 [Bryobacteraceae bacterium]